MAIDTQDDWRTRGAGSARSANVLTAIVGRINRAFRFLGQYAFSSLTRRIAILNLVALILLVTGNLYLNQFREGLIDARVQSLLTQGEIIAGAIATSATVDIDSIRLDPNRLLELQAGEILSPSTNDLGLLDFTINPEAVAPILRRLISPTRTRARIYDRDGILIIDSESLYSRGQILRFDLPPPGGADDTSWLEELQNDLRLWFRRGDHPLYVEHGPREGRAYPEVAQALAGESTPIVRMNERGEVIVSVAIPIQRMRTVLGAMLLSTQGGDIDQIVLAERLAILRTFLVAAVVTLVLSVILAGTIAGPVHRLAAAAERVRRGTRKRERIPDFSNRNDEIGHLARALRDMTDALYNRIDAIGSFAADVSHELKNPLTSLRSAVETLPLVKNKVDRDRLISVIQHDVNRLDRLISDISDASRLDAELQRREAEPVDLCKLLDTVVSVTNEVSGDGQAPIILSIAPSERPHAYYVDGHDSRLGQVITNLIDNARSFSPPNGVVQVSASRKGGQVDIMVEDDGPGISPDNLERIFERFYTDRGDDAADFGQNSGLGLSISRQIVEAHGGHIHAENRIEPDPNPNTFGTDRVTGARFVVSLPALG
ncbi:MAG: sensor histidine kinase [Pseudomonadota bacterium]